MGDAPNVIHVIDCIECTDDAELKYIRHEIREDDSFVFAFQEAPNDSSYANIVDGALFVQYKQTKDLPRDPPVPRKSPGSMPISQQGWAEWTFSLQSRPDETDKEKKERMRVEMLAVVVLPEGYAIDDFDVWPLHVKAVGLRLAFLFHPRNDDGAFLLSWKIARSGLSISAEVQRAFEGIRKNRRRDDEKLPFPSHDPQPYRVPSRPPSSDQPVSVDGPDPTKKSRTFNKEKESVTEQDHVSWERIAIFASGIVFVVVLLLLAIGFPEPSPFQYTVFRIVLALAAAGVGALLPGFIEFAYRDLVRAGGALAIFAVVYFFTPADLVVSQPAVSAECEAAGARMRSIQQQIANFISDQCILANRLSAFVASGTVESWNKVKEKSRPYLASVRKLDEDIRNSPALFNAMSSASYENFLQLLDLKDAVVSDQRLGPALPPSGNDREALAGLAGRLRTLAQRASAEVTQLTHIPLASCTGAAPRASTRGGRPGSGPAPISWPPAPCTQ